MTDKRDLEKRVADAMERYAEDNMIPHLAYLAPSEMREMARAAITETLQHLYDEFFFEGKWDIENFAERNGFTLKKEE